MSDPVVVTEPPHFVQFGNAPVFVGSGADDLACACGESVLVRGYRPGALLAIAIECAQCGEATTTPGLPAGEVLPPGVRVVTRERQPVPTSMVLAPETVLADRDELLRVDELTRPRVVSDASIALTEATVSATAADYDRLTGGRLATDLTATSAIQIDGLAKLPALPLAWALGRLETGVERPGWWCLAEEPDAVATIQLGAFREFEAAWSGHPLYDAMVASAAAEGFSTHALAVFAAARAMVESGNRVGFTRPPAGQTRIDSFHIEASPTERHTVLVRPFDLFDWPGGQGADVAVARARAIDALIASQGRINLRRPGVLVLSVGAVRRQVDPVIIQGVAEVLDARWRRHRGLLGVALVLPKVYPTARSDLVTFGWTFLPAVNPHHPGAVMRPVNLPGTTASAM
jgi:hypothetical protein